MDIMKNMLMVSEWATGFWPNIIKWFAGVGSIAFGVILLTIVLKTILFPLDFWQKMSSRKMTAQQALMKPELDEIQAKYKDNPEMLKAKQQEIYRKYNTTKSTSTGCIGMLVYMAVTMLIFFTLFSGLTNISRTKINYEYYQLQQTYNATYAEAIVNGQTDEEAVNAAQAEVVVKYEEIKESFLSIKNVWRPDNWSTVFPDGEQFIKSTNTRFGAYEYVIVESENPEEVQKIKYVFLSTNEAKLVDANQKEYIEPYVDMQGNIYLLKGEGLSEPTTVVIGDKTYDNIVYAETSEQYKTYEEATVNLVKTTFVNDYNKVTSGITEKYKGQWNGYLILVILAGTITFLSSWFSTLGVKTKDKDGNIVKGAKPKPLTGIILAGVMVFFTISYTSVFALYIITNSAISMLYNYFTNLILNKIESKPKTKKGKKEVVVADYVRK